MRVKLTRALFLLTVGVVLTACGDTADVETAPAPAPAPAPAAAAAAAPAPATGTGTGGSTLSSVDVSGTDIILEWSQAYSAPIGGYDIYINGVDTGPQYRTTLNTVTISGLDTSVAHCFSVEARYTETNEFFSSNELCSEATQQPVTNNPPTITGTPAMVVVLGEGYSFTPAANDIDNDTLTFSILNRPSWANFNSSTGLLNGTPDGVGHIGVTEDILITVDDGESSVSLALFDIAVVADSQDSTPPLISNVQINMNNPAPRSAQITWNTDELASSELNFGIDTSYGNVQTENGYSLDHFYWLNRLTPSTRYYYQITATDEFGNAALPISGTFFMNPVSQGDWVAPIGIRPPDFGIEETHMMYENAQYDFGNGLEAYKDSGNGPYTHFVDNQHPNATDINNPYGTPNLPRETIPQNLTPGSVVEVHNGPYSYAESVHGGTYLPILNELGTAEKPIFIRGPNNDDRFEIATLPGNNEILLRDVSYLIMENVFINGPTLKIYQPTDHFSIRHSEITGEDSSGILIWTYKNDYSAGSLKQHIVIYNNDIHNNGVYPAAAETGDFGIMIDNATENVWVVDNNMYNNGDDSLQVIDRSWVPAIRGIVADYIYVGRNVMHHDGENAIDVKGSKNVIISQNEIYGYRSIYSNPTSAGEAIRINDEGEQDNIWIIYNHIYDSTDGIDPVNALFFPYVIGNLIHDVETAINRDTTVVTNNTIYNCGTGVDRRRAPHYELSNNIIANCDTPYMSCSSCGTDVIHSNILFDNSTSRTCTNCSYDDPLLNSPSNPGVPQTGSPAIDAAGSTSDAYTIFYNTYGIGIRTDIDGNPRPQQPSDWDIGAYETP